MTLLRPPAAPARWLAALALCVAPLGCDDDGATVADDTGPVACIGLDLDDAAWSTQPFPATAGDPAPDASRESAGASEEASGPCTASPGTCIGAPAPEFGLTDFQPQSCGLGATYGMRAFAGYVTVVALLAGW